MPRPISNKIINIGGLVEMTTKDLEPEVQAIVDHAQAGAVIVSFGTFANTETMSTKMKRTFLDAFGRFPNYEFIWKIEVSDEQEAKMFAKYKNVHPIKWMDQKSLLMHPKVRAFVSHCGLNSVSEAARSGVPILAIPLFGDQLYNAILARMKGIAVQLHVGHINVQGAEQLIWDGLDRSIISQFNVINEAICRELTNDVELIRRLEAEHFDVALAEFYNICPYAIFHRIGVKTKLGTMAVPFSQLVGRRFGIPTFSSYVINSLTPMDGGHEMNFWERLCNFYNDLYDWLYLSNLSVNLEQPIVREAFGQNFPPLKQIARNVSLFFSNSNQFFEMPRPISNKIINIGGLVEMTTKDLEPEVQAIVDNAQAGAVIVSFGTFANTETMSTKMKRTFLDAFGRFPNYEFIWKIEVSDEQEAKMFAKYKNVHPVKWMDQKSLLMHPKVRAFVSHCGLNSVSEAARSGVPILAIPLFGDQLYNAILARMKGIAVQLHVGHLNVQGAEQLIWDGLDRVLNDPSYAQNAKILKRKFDQTPFGPKQMLTRWVEFAAEFTDLNELNLPWEDELGTLAYYSIDVILFTAAVLGIFACVLFKLAQSVAKCLKSVGKRGQKLKEN
uniref:glucuronosyltransferase n=1 Tax=Globodera pallida TaxID=36090 RepID=A0A183BM23_GLOPA